MPGEEYLPAAAEPWQAWSDGCASPNPGRIGLGGILLAPDGTRHHISERAPHGGCNNEAEARALLATLRHALALGARAIHAHSDSDVVVRLAQTASSTEAARLAPLLDELRGTIAEFARFRLDWLPQHRNTEADGLARAALGLPPRAPARPPRRRRH
ncbi:MAG: ribonuclease HI family protein [Candidatus Dactylopiibacterium sp.]|nr:ribonuclease HI family protein [Candidatus Dactylopiibacterium sp.]